MKIILKTLNLRKSLKHERILMYKWRRTIQEKKNKERKINRYLKQTTDLKRQTSQNRFLETNEKMKKLRWQQILPLKWLRNKLFINLKKKLHLIKTSAQKMLLKMLTKKNQKKEPNEWKWWRKNIWKPGKSKNELKMKKNKLKLHFNITIHLLLSLMAVKSCWC